MSPSPKIKPHIPPHRTKGSEQGKNEKGSERGKESISKIFVIVLCQFKSILFAMEQFHKLQIWFGDFYVK